MSNIFQYEIALAASSSNGIAHSQTPSGAGDLTLTSSTVTLDTPRRVLFTPAGAEGGNGTIWTVYGTSRSGAALTETVAGVDNPTTVYTTQDFATVTRIAVNKAQAGAVTVGTNGVASSPWFMLNQALTPMNVGIGVTVGGTASFTVQYTYDNPNAPFSGTFPTTWDISALASKSAATDGSLTVPVYAIRVTQNSFSTGGTVSLIAIQAGLG